jgi:hypothetical protein
LREGNEVEDRDSKERRVVKKIRAMTRVSLCYSSCSFGPTSKLAKNIRGSETAVLIA